MLRISLLADLKVFALSDRSIVGQPHLPSCFRCVSDLFSGQSHSKLQDKIGTWKTGVLIFKHYKNLFEFDTVLLVCVSPMERSKTANISK